MKFLTNTKVEKNGDERAHPANFTKKSGQNLFQVEPGVNLPVMYHSVYRPELIGMLVIGIIGFPDFMIFHCLPDGVKNEQQLLIRHGWMQRKSHPSWFFGKIADVDLVCDFF